MDGTGPRGIVIVHRAPEVRRGVADHLRPTLRPLHVTATVTDGRAALAAHPELLVAEHAVLADEPGFLEEAAAAGVRACLLAVTANDQVETADLARFPAFALSSAGALGPPRPLDELAVTALKLLRGDLFGMEKYLAWGCVAVAHHLTCAGDRRGVQAALIADLAARGYGSRLRWLAAQAADELVCNALFHGPVDQAGTHVRSAQQRVDDFALAADEQVAIRWAADDRYFAIEVVDRWGSLAVATLARCVRRALTPGLAPRPAGTAGTAGAGAGLGLALTASCVHHLVCNLDPGRWTEMIALFDVRGGGVRLELVPSFHAFVATAAERSAA